MTEYRKQYLFKFWFVFWSMMALVGVVDIIKDNQYAWHSFSIVSFVITIINISIFRWKL